jgi:hypothetical protein
LMKEAALMLASMGYTIAVCTANKPIRRCLGKLMIQDSEMEIAEQTSLAQPEENWGSYYGSQPVVLAGDISQGAAAIVRLFGDGS